MDINVMAAMVAASAAHEARVVMSDDPMVEDDSIEIVGTNLNVQVGEGYIGLNEDGEDEEGYYFRDLGIFDRTPAGFAKVCDLIRREVNA